MTAIHTGPSCSACVAEGVVPARPAAENGVCRAHALLARVSGRAVGRDLVAEAFREIESLRFFRREEWTA